MYWHHPTVHVHHYRAPTVRGTTRLAHALRTRWTNPISRPVDSSRRRSRQVGQLAEPPWIHPAWCIIRFLFIKLKDGVWTSSLSRSLYIYYSWFGLNISRVPFTLSCYHVRSRKCYIFVVRSFGLRWYGNVRSKFSALQCVVFKSITDEGGRFHPHPSVFKALSCASIHYDALASITVRLPTRAASPPTSQFHFSTSMSTTQAIFSSV
jgi:hypothetical protein